MMSAGSAVAAAAASVCCVGPAVGPLLVSLLGASGTVALEGLRPYAPTIIVLSGALLAWSFWLNHRNRKACAVGRAAAIVTRTSHALLWLSMLVWLAAAIAVAYGFVA